jgi:uncharacterized membrane protein HdeD (DUF308 family)
MLLKHRWVLIIRGLFAVMFGAITLVWPSVTVFAIVTIIGAFLLLDGMIEVWVGFASRGHDAGWWSDALLGVLAAFAGVAIIAWPGVTAVGLMVFIGASMVIYGVTMVWQAFKLRTDLANEWMLLANGALSLGLGLVFIAFPGAGAVSLVWLIAVYLILFGGLLIVTGWKLRAFAASLREDATITQQPGRR